jgi:hypothetical protein
MKRQRPELPDRYDAFLQELKERIRSAQVRASLSVNRELLLLYWSIFLPGSNQKDGEQK